MYRDALYGYYSLYTYGLQALIRKKHGRPPLLLHRREGRARRVPGTLFEVCKAFDGLGELGDGGVGVTVADPVDDAVADVAFEDDLRGAVER